MNYRIEGGALPVVLIELNTGESLISEAGGRTWMKGEVLTEAIGGGAKKMLGRILSKESLFLSKYTAQGPAEIAFASSFPGSIIAKELRAGESIIAQKSAFLVASDTVELSTFFNKSVGKGLFGGEGFIMQKVTGPGMAFFEIDGHCVEYDLAAGERIVCDTGVLALMDESCSLDIQMVKGFKNVLFGGEGLVDTVVTGPGKVMFQSMTIPHIAGLIGTFLPDKK